MCGAVTARFVSRMFFPSPFRWNSTWTRGHVSASTHLQLLRSFGSDAAYTHPLLDRQYRMPYGTCMCVGGPVRTSDQLPLIPRSCSGDISLTRKALMSPCIYPLFPLSLSSFLARAPTHDIDPRGPEKLPLPFDRKKKCARAPLQCLFRIPQAFSAGNTLLYT